MKFPSGFVQEISSHGNYRTVLPPSARFLRGSRRSRYKLYHLVQRPFPTSAETVGAWTGILNLLTWASLFTNAALLTWTVDVFAQPPFASLDLPELIWSRKPAGRSGGL